MTTAFVTSRRVEFSDTDAAGIMHFAAFFRMMEQAEHELLRSVGLSVHAPGGSIGWPRAHAKCDFRSAARFEDVLQIEVQIVRLGNRSVTYGHRFLRDGQLVAEGQITAVCCHVSAGQAPESQPIPAAMAEKLRDFVAS
jgi:4-hydroxybenzoyl-CoA thioesterase/acyl-CoA thioester hydrolase